MGVPFVGGMEHWTDGRDRWQQAWRYADGPDYEIVRDGYGRPVGARSL